MDKHLSEAKSKMEKSVESIANELKHIRTGRPSPVLLEEITADYYNTPTPIPQMASVSVAERSLVVKPWDKSVLKVIEKAILASQLGLTPINDGTSIRLNFPPPTGEQRKKLVKMVHDIIEDGKVSIRNIRRDAIKDVKEGQKNGDIPEDEAYRLEDKIQELTDEYVDKMDEMFKEKETEIMEV
ncbi:MAG: ribosome recycling factor [Thermotogota bacterium]|nr:ribosome recycling factor [Thermotogota bacterium]